MQEILKILLVEDDSIDARNFERVLEQTGFQYSFKHLDSQEKGFQEIQQNNYDIAFLDYHMPGGNGLSLLKSLREIGVRIPIVIITSYADPKVAVEMIQAGASDYIPKSLLTPDGIAQSIRSVVKVRSIEKKRIAAESQLKKVENRLGTIISNTPIILFALDPLGTFRLGLGKHWDDFNSKSGLVIGSSIEHVFEDYPEVIEGFQKSLEHGVQKVTAQINHFIFEITFTPIYDGDQNIKEVLGLASDVTERAKGEESLLAAKQLAEQTSTIKQEFIANLSHEIRTPLNAIIGFTHLLEETQLNDLQSDFIDSIRISGENLLSLVNDVLDFSKIEAGKLELVSEFFNLEEVVGAVVKVLEGRAFQKKLKLKSDFSQEIPHHLIGDANRVYQVLMNLVGNAIKFTPKGRVTVKSSILQRDDHSCKVLLEVEDTGVGMPEEKLDKIFESFTQLEENEKGVGGTGLGLAIVQKIVRLMNGEITVQSKMGKGTVFRVVLPFVLGSEPKKEERPASNFASVLDGAKVLLAEDNAMNQKLVIMYLRKYNVQIDLAEDGYQAVKAVESNDYDLVLMDVQMPNMDGLEAARAIRTKLSEAKRNVPILAMTAHAFKEEVDNCFEAGMSAHISKPIDKDAFLEIISGLIANRSDLNEASIKNVRIKQGEAAVDLSYLRDMAGDNEDFIKEMIAIFKEDSPILISGIKEAFKNKDWSALSKLAHKYRSPAVMMGMKHVADLAGEIEYHPYESGEGIDDIEKLIEAIGVESDKAIDFIEKNF